MNCCESRTPTNLIQFYVSNASCNTQRYKYDHGMMHSNSEDIVCVWNVNPECVVNLYALLCTFVLVCFSSCNYTLCWWRYEGVRRPVSSKSTLLYRVHVFIADAGTRVALIIQFQRDDVMEPMRWQIQDVPCLQHDLVACGLREVAIPIFQVDVIRTTPIDLGMARGWMALGVEMEPITLVGVVENVPPCAAEHDDAVAASVKVILRNDALHSEAAVDATLFGWRLEIQIARPRLEEWELIEKVLRRPSVAFSVRAGLAATDQAKVPVRLVGPQDVVIHFPGWRCGVGLLQPIPVRHA
mmetsp:Transcript_16282/g.45159  ORF Transcript_16282/g.45159 Transcript_16282/m.45159 type:complete len:298 (+) Transcript_16282:870-1763(+)